MDPIMVIGIGNPDRGDDAIGLAIARALKQADPPGVTVIEHRGDAADLVERLGRTAAAILVDAAVSGAAPGTFRRIDVHRQPLPASWFTGSTHGLGVVTAIELAGVLGSLPSRCIVYAVEAASFDHGATISPDAMATIPPVTEAIGRDLARLRMETARPEAARHHA
jgi:hydrogenase maturation protease